jgi:hypothetical protein
MTVYAACATCCAGWRSAARGAAQSTGVSAASARDPRGLAPSNRQRRVQPGPLHRSTAEAHIGRCSGPNSGPASAAAGLVSRRGCDGLCQPLLAAGHLGDASSRHSQPAGTTVCQGEHTTTKLGKADPWFGGIRSCSGTFAARQASIRSRQPCPAPPPAKHVSCICLLVPTAC